MNCLKAVITLVILGFLFHLLNKYLKPKEAEPESADTVVEGEIRFDNNLGHKYSWIKQQLDHFASDKKYWKQKILI